MVRCSCCGRDIDALGQDNVSCVSDEPLCEDCGGQHHASHHLEEKFRGKIEFYGNHYFPGQEVIGSQMNVQDGHVFIYDDEENYVDGIGDMTRYERAEIDKSTLERYNFDTESWESFCCKPQMTDSGFYACSCTMRLKNHEDYCPQCGCVIDWSK